MINTKKLMFKSKKSNIFGHWRLLRTNKASLHRRRMVVFSKYSPTVLALFKFNTKSINGLSADFSLNGRSQQLKTYKKSVMFGRRPTYFTKYYSRRTKNPARFAFKKKKFYTLRYVRSLMNWSETYKWSKWWKKHHPSYYRRNVWETYLDNIEEELITSDRKFVTRLSAKKRRRSTKPYNWRLVPTILRRGFKWERRAMSQRLGHKRYLRSLHKYSFIIDSIPLRGVISSIMTFAPDTDRKFNRQKRLNRTILYYFTLYDYWHKYTQLVAKSRNSEASRSRFLKHDYLYGAIVNHVRMYFFLLNSMFYDMFLYLKKKKFYKELSVFRVFFTFKTKRFFLNLTNREGRTLLSITPGLFLKFLNKKKSFKKNRMIVLLMAKYLRKVFLIVGIRRFDGIIRKVPYMLNEILNNMLTPLGHSFTNPFTEKTINEPKFKYPNISLKLLIFKNNKPFNYLKVRNRGRIKRKILRKVVRFNKMVD